MAELVQLEKLHDGLLWIVTLHDGSRAGVDAWERTVRQYWTEFPNKSDRYLIYDTTPIPNLAFTNYLQQRADVMAKEDGNATGRVALVMRLHPTVLYFFDVFVKITGKRYQPKLEVKFFSQREDALNWVAESLPARVG